MICSVAGGKWFIDVVVGIARVVVNDGMSGYCWVLAGRERASPFGN